MMYTAKVAVCSDILTKHSTQSEHHIKKFCLLNLVVRKETARLYNVKTGCLQYSEHEGRENV
jgi:hypothetical protein